MNKIMIRAHFAAVMGWTQLVFGSTLFMREHEVWAWIVTGLGIINLIASAVLGAKSDEKCMTK